MGRPKLLYSVRRNGNSVQLFEGGVYVGSYALPELCALVKAEKRNHTVPETAQQNYIKEPEI